MNSLRFRSFPGNDAPQIEHLGVEGMQVADEITHVRRLYLEYPSFQGSAPRRCERLRPPKIPYQGLCTQTCWLHHVKLSLRLFYTSSFPSRKARPVCRCFNHSHAYLHNIPRLCHPCGFPRSSLCNGPSTTQNFFGLATGSTLRQRALFSRLPPRMPTTISGAS